MCDYALGAEGIRAIPLAAIIPSADVSVATDPDALPPMKILAKKALFGQCRMPSNFLTYRL